MDNPAAVADLMGFGLEVGDGVGQVPQSVAQRYVDRAWRDLQLEVPSLVSRVGEAEGQIHPDSVVDVVVAATLRVLRNTDGVESRSGGIDDWQESEKLADATLDVYFTAAELRRLQPSNATTGEWSGSFKFC